VTDWERTTVYVRTSYGEEKTVAGSGEGSVAAGGQGGTAVVKDGRQ